MYNFNPYYGFNYKNNNKTLILFSLFFSVLIYLRYGYQLGLEDGPEFLPFAKVLQNPLLYKNDLFMQSMLGMVWNERTVFGLFFSLFPSIEWGAFIVHFILTFFQILGVGKLAQLILDETFLAVFLCVIFFFITVKIEIGQTTLYYHNIQGETFANTCIVWALVALVNSKIKWTYFFVGIATYFHALIGFQSFLFISGTYLFYGFSSKKFSGIKTATYCAFIYIFSCCWVVILIFMSNNHEAISSDQQFMNLTYHFSLKGHFDPQTFSRKGYILFVISLIAGFYYYKKQQPLIFYTFITLSIGYFIYIIGFYANSYLITSSWWFRTNMWVMLLGQIAVIGFLKDITFFRQYIYFIVAAVVLVGLGWGVLVYEQIPKMYPWKDLSIENDEIKTALACKKISEIDDLFIQPLTFTGLKYFGERASYVEYNRILRTKKDILIWYSRLGEVYKLTTAIETARNPNFEKEINQNYNNLTDLELKILSKKGVKYAIFPINHVSTFSTIYKNATYKIIRINSLSNL